MSPRKRGIAPTATGQQKLLALKAAGRGDGQRFTYEAIAEHIFQKTSVSIEAKTVNRFFRGEGIDRDSVTAICQGLDLEIIEIVDPNEWYPPKLPQSEPQEAINWSAICRQQNAKLRRSPTEEGFEPEIFVPLGLMERKQQQRRPLNQEMGMDQVYGVEEKAEVTRKFEHQEFLTYIGLGGKQAENAKNVAIIGEPGAGKTTLLADLAQVIDKHQGLAIAISLGSFGAWQSLEPKRNLKDYLEQKWLEDALPDQNVSETDRLALADRFRQEGVWLLLDGLDEMQASSPVEALTYIEREVRSGYLQKARVVLTCRVNVWDANLSNPLREFETYKTLDFAEGQRDDFIRQWFTKKGNLALGEGLISQLKESGRERICELVKNPLRLVLLCYIWTQQAGELPETKAQFYQRYLRYFYEWKKEVRNLTGKRQQQAQLHQALGRLAIAGIESSSRYRLSENLAVQEMGEDCFQLAVDLGWLNIVDREQGTDEAVYAFFHPTFQEFFAACGVEDWDFFFPRNHVDRPVEGKVYRIFEAKWKEVILLWLGRGDVKDEEKEAFIQALVKFEDNCKNFYFYRAFYLAAAGISEFKHCFLADKIVNKLISQAVVEWGFCFGYFEPETEEWTTFLDLIAESARDILPETDRSRAITALINLLSSPHEFTRNLAAEILGRIGHGNKEAITALINLLFSTDLEDIRWTAVESLGKIGHGNKEAIAALIKLPYSFIEIESLLVAENLGKIGQGNQEAITALINFLSSPYEFIRLQAAERLEQIDPGNQEAITALIKLLSSPDIDYTETRGLAAKSLGEIGQGNQEAITALINLLSSPDEENRRQATWCLKKIGQGNQEAINALTKLLSSPDTDKNIRSQAKEILGEIGQGNQEAINTLTKLLSSSNTDKNIRSQAIGILGKIGQGNQEAINTLVKLLSSFGTDEFMRSQATWCLKQIGQGNQEAISALKYFLSSSSEYIRYESAATLIEIDHGNEEAIFTLINLFSSPNTDENISWRIRNEFEYHIRIPQGNEEVITALIQLLSSPNETIRQNIAKSLRTVDSGNKEVIAALINLISFPEPNEYARRAAVESLGKIGQGNEKAITVLTNLLSSSDELTRLAAADSLRKIDPSNNKEAIFTVINLLSSYDIEEYTRYQAQDVLGQIPHPQGNQEVIAAYILLASFPHESTSLQALQCLGFIGKGNKEAIAALINLLSSSDIDEYTRREAAGSLEKILQKGQMPGVVTALKDYLSGETYQNDFAQFENCYKVLWKCAQTLSYPEFYQAWHHPSITPHPEVLDTTAIGSTATTQTLNLQLLPNELPAHCLYLDAHPLNPYSLPELSQELCNLIHQHLNQYPIPSADNLPQLKRHLLPLLAQHPQLTLIFGHAYPSNTLLTFCQQLNATIAIAWINDQAIPNLQTFSPQDPNLLEKILNWLNR